MKVKRMSVKVMMSILGGSFAAVGAIFMIAACVMLAADSSFMKTAEETTAVITDIDTDRRVSHGEERTDHTVYIEYIADGEVYNEPLGEYNSGMYEGEEITVYYDPDKPSDVRTGSKLMQYIFLGIGALFFIIGASFVSVIVLKNRRIKLLKQSGDRLSGTITRVEMNRSVKINNRHPYKAECEVTDPYSGERYLYSSENITSDISDLVGMEVTVYADRNDRSRYYVDIRELMDRYIEENRIHDYR
ncbi:MAG: DUF3592 domain-containing protein [Porcipelethomonas sp.]